MKDTDAGPIVIFGGRSEIGLELATRLAQGATVMLVASVSRSEGVVNSYDTVGTR